MKVLSTMNLRISFVLSLILLCSGCYFYKVQSTKSPVTPAALESVDSLNSANNRFFILRSGANSFHITKYSLSEDQKTLNCILDSVPQAHLLHITKGAIGRRKYKKYGERDVINEVHFYTNEIDQAYGAYSIPLDKIFKIEVLEKDRKKTASVFVIAITTSVIGGLALAGLIIFLTKSSCPFVSAYDGNGFSLQGEIYGGAIYPQLARHDYIPLNMKPLSDGSLQIKISNELKERQYTDMAELLVISHDPKTRIYPDESGTLYTISDPQPPVEATLNARSGVLPALVKSGDNAILYLDDSSRADARNEVVLKFNKPVNASAGKLLLSLKNSYWLDMLYGQLAKGFGNYYMTYIKNQKDKSAEELIRWTKEQQLPLEVSVKTATGWKTISFITTIGPLATRNMIIPLNLEELQDSITEVKLSTGFMFWEIDYAAIDFSANTGYTVRKLTPQRAKDEQKKNVLPQLQKEDGVYLEQPQIGNVATIVYKPGALPDSLRHTFILHTKGYYEHIRDFSNPPDLKFLQQFTKPDAFPAFGMKMYQELKTKTIHDLAEKK